MPRFQLCCNNARILYILESFFFFNSSANLYVSFESFWLLFTFSKKFILSFSTPLSFNLMNFRVNRLFCPKFIVFQIYCLITIFFLFYIWIYLIGSPIPKPGPRFTFCISCIGNIKLIVIYSKLHLVGKWASPWSILFENRKR